MENNEIYLTRRQRLSQTYSRTLFVIPSGVEAKRSHSVHYRFKVASDFYYLSGLQISDAVLIVAGPKTYLLKKEGHDPVWGEFISLTSEDQKKLRGLTIDKIENLYQVVSDLLADFDRVAFSFDRDPCVEKTVNSLIAFQKRSARSRHQIICLCDSRLLVGSIRATKEKGEIENLKTAGEKSSEVHRLLMQQKTVGKTEREISNWIEGQFLLRNMQWASYETIVGAGERSTILHARATDQMILSGDLVLVDAGAEWRGYCADITRTFPSGNKFSKEQKFIYQTVLEAQKKVISLVQPGASLQQLHREVLEFYKEAFQVDEATGKKLMPHSTSHWIGLDVHDPCFYVDDCGSEIKLQMNMTFTVEPGLYFNQIAGFEKYNGIGVRIEDDVVVTEKGCQLLTSVQKEVDEIEQLRAMGDN